MTQRLALAGLVLASVLVGCSADIPVPTPAEVRVKQIAFGPRGAIELSWHLVLRTSEYRVHYDSDGPGAPYSGRGLSLVRWPAGCGDLDAGARDAGTRDAGTRDVGTTPGPDLRPTDLGPAPDASWPGAAVDSPITIPGAWCLEVEDTFTEAGRQLVPTPAARPRVRLKDLLPGQTYVFSVQAVRGSTASAFSPEASITAKEKP